MDAAILDFIVPPLNRRPPVTTGALSIDFAAERASANGKHVPLTGYEFRCLALLAEHRGRTVTKEMFLRALYPDGNEPEMKIIDVFVCKLRRKLREAGAADVIGTVWGRGYVLR